MPLHENQCYTVAKQIALACSAVVLALKTGLPRVKRQAVMQRMEGVETCTLSTTTEDCCRAFPMSSNVSPLRYQQFAGISGA
ncbi:hypothetical protein LMG28727_07458 [Paraburkholderia kirstenboschensis]|nr:hypothetical protein LMG28727_07458 [Paraburkholderia kirstenboschensis]